MRLQTTWIALKKLLIGPATLNARRSSLKGNKTRNTAGSSLTPRILRSTRNKVSLSFNGLEMRRQKQISLFFGLN